MEGEKINLKEGNEEEKRKTGNVGQSAKQYVTD